MWEVMTACVIMHNMIVEEERDESMFDQGWDCQGQNIAPQPGPPADLVDFLAVQREMRDTATHFRPQKDLVANLWRHLGNR